METSIASAEVFVLRKKEVEAFISALDSAELRGIAQALLIDGKEKLDLQLEYGLTRSQVDKRMKKLLERATEFSVRN